MKNLHLTHQDLQDTESLFHRTLMELSCMDKSDFDHSLKVLLRRDAQVLQVQRVSYWNLAEDSSSISLEALYLLSEESYDEGPLVLRASDYPRYFGAIKTHSFIMADDAQGHEHTREFALNYLKPAGITSMMDIPVRFRGKLVGIICHEHVGPMRSWALREQEFALAIAEMLSLSLEAFEAKSMEEDKKDLLAQLGESNRALELKVEEATRLNTTLKSTQDQLLKAQKLESVGRLAGGIAHDFNNLLSGIMGYAAILHYELRDKPSSLAKVEIILKSAERGAELTHQLLGFARQGRYENIPLDLNRIVSEARTLLRGSLKSNIRVEVSLDPGLWAVRGDSNQILQVLMNLGVNARDAMPLGGEVSLTTGNAEFGAANAAPPGLSQGKYVRITVADSGTGIDPHDIGRIFDPFFTTKQVGQGSGLGLSMAYGIMENHGGHIYVKSRPGEGATFSLYFPAELAEKPRESKAEERKAVADTAFLNNATVLIADDEEVIRQLEQDILKPHGALVLTARDGHQAVEVFKKAGQGISMILMDMTMPGMDGPAAYAEIRKINPEVPVLFLSGYGAESRITDDLRQGRVGFIQKPFTPEELLRKMAAHFKKT